MRGPGETQLETDRRMIRQKIQLLRKKLGDDASQPHRIKYKKLTR